MFICDSSFVDLLTDYQIIFTVIYTCATDDLTAFIGNSRLTGISSVTRFIGRILDIYPPQVNIPILFNCYIFRSRMSKSKIIWIWQILLVILIHQRKRKWQTQRFWINTLQRKRYFWMSDILSCHGNILSSFVVVMPFRWQIMQSTRLLDRLMKRLVAKIFKHFVHEWKNSKTIKCFRKKTTLLVSSGWTVVSVLVFRFDQFCYRDTGTTI